MKQFFKILIIAFSMIVAASCGVASKYSNDPFKGEGYAESMNENIAKEKAYQNAVAEVTRKYNVHMTERAHQTYASNETGKGKMNESVNYNSSFKSHSDATLTDVKVVKETTKKVGGLFRIRIVVAVEPENIE